MLAGDVRDHLLLLRAPREEKGEWISDQAGELGHEADCIVGGVQASSDRGWFAERVLHGVDDAGREEPIVVWIERKAGAIWAVGRVVNPQLRNEKSAKSGDYLFEGYELEDALEQANTALEDDRTVSEGDGRDRALSALHARGVPEAARGLVLRPRLAASAARRLRPVEVRVGDRIPVRVVRREAERLVDSRLDSSEIACSSRSASSCTSST